LPNRALDNLDITKVLSKYFAPYEA